MRDPLGGSTQRGCCFQRQKLISSIVSPLSTTLIDTALFPQPVNSKPLPPPPHQPLPKDLYFPATAPHALADRISPRSLLDAPSSSSLPSPSPHLTINIRPDLLILFTILVDRHPLQTASTFSCLLLSPPLPFPPPRAFS